MQTQVREGTAVDEDVVGPLPLFLDWKLNGFPSLKFTVVESASLRHALKPVVARRFDEHDLVAPIGRRTLEQEGDVQDDDSRRRGRTSEANELLPEALADERVNEALKKLPILGLLWPEDLLRQGLPVDGLVRREDLGAKAVPEGLDDFWSRKRVMGGPIGIQDGGAGFGKKCCDGGFSATDPTDKPDGQDALTWHEAPPSLPRLR